MSQAELSVLVTCVENILNNSRSYPLSVLIKAKKACDKNNLTEYSTQLELKIERAKKKREKNKEALKKLEEKGLKVNSPVKCKNCFIRKDPCDTSVAKIREGYVVVYCKEVVYTDENDLPSVVPTKIVLVIS